EHVLGAALEQLHYSRDRYWADLRVAVPASTVSHLDQRTDVVQIGVVALSLILGRPLESNEYPTLIADVLASAKAISAHGDREPLPAGLRLWLARALQLDSRASFQTALEARSELERMLTDEEESVDDVIVEEPAPAPPPKPAAVPPPAPTRVEPIAAAHTPSFAPPAVSHVAPPVTAAAPTPAPPKPASTGPGPAAPNAPPTFTPPPMPPPVIAPVMREPVVSAPIAPIVSSVARPVERSKRPLALVAAIAVVVLATGGYVARRFVFTGGP